VDTEEAKQVFIGDCLIGKAATWSDVHALVRARRIFFINGARGAEGPSSFHLAANAAERAHATVTIPWAG
jgi:hypothetical protein